MRPRQRTIIDEARSARLAKLSRPNAWMYVDETASNDGPYIGASAVLLTSTGRRSLKACTEEFRATLPSKGIPEDIEIHATVWVVERKLFPDTNAFIRISALGDYLRRVSKCRDIFIINILADTSVHVPGMDVRAKIWETLFWEFELWLTAHKLRGHTIFDKDRVGQVVAIAKRMRTHSLRRQLLDPEPADSKHHNELQLADVCAYFALQRFIPNNQVKKAGATNYINRIERLCPHETKPGEALESVRHF